MIKGFQNAWIRHFHLLAKLLRFWSQIPSAGVLSATLRNISCPVSLNDKQVVWEPNWRFWRRLCARQSQPGNMHWRHSISLSPLHEWWCKFDAELGSRWFDRTDGWQRLCNQLRRAIAELPFLCHSKMSIHTWWTSRCREFDFQRGFGWRLRRRWSHAICHCVFLHVLLCLNWTAA